MNQDSFIASMFPLGPALMDGAQQEFHEGVSYLAACDGLWRSVRLPWINSLLPVATAPAVNVPYGRLHESVQVLVPAPDRSIWSEFLATAKAAMPSECAAALLWNTETKAWRYAVRRAISASHGHIDYQEVQVFEDEILVVDIHSHARHPAFFSRTDDADDQGSMKISVVFGNIDQETPSLAARINLVDQRRVMVFDHNANWSVLPCP